MNTRSNPMSSESDSSGFALLTPVAGTGRIGKEMPVA